MRPIAGDLAGRWKGRPAEIVTADTSPAPRSGFAAAVRPVPGAAPRPAGPAAGLARLLAAEEAPFVVLAALSAAWLLEPGEIQRLVAAAAKGVVKASLQRTPIELYAAPRDRLVALLEKAAARGGRGGLRETLFEGVLTTSLDTIEELAGELYFLADLSELHRQNLRLVTDGQAIVRLAARFPEPTEPTQEAVIAARARVRASWIAPGAQVEGDVEESVVFPGAVVQRGAQVARSVVMNGVVVGAGACVTNALLLPWGDGAGVMRPAATIGETSVIGQRQSSTCNADYPDQIRDGLAVVGMDVTLPAGFRMEGGALVAPGADPAELRRLKVLRRGQTAAAPGGAAAASADGSRGPASREGTP